ncbi:MAG: HAMP domain-containing histidine kinase [Lewinellaceae bacterium]|nr:HAMP domain-containing histidine kinase [Saprospiraceae bacterium]MCB9338192.1 HAMP domain-containing histidine kinase [Lewinellaceae bacterium]
MKNSTIIRVVLFGALAIIGIIAIQTYLLVNTWNAEAKEFQEKVNIALQNVAKQFEKLGSTTPTYDLINQVSSNYYVVDINNTINANNLEIFLRRELEEVGLREDFEYGIYNCDTRKMAYGKYISYSQEAMSHVNEPKQQLPVHDHDNFLYYFGVRFPNREAQILDSMKLAIILSVILFVTILFFMYSIFIILRQKRLSEMQKDFINNMTHEFKTPISTIKISSEVFLNSPEINGNKRLLQYASIINEQNQRLNKQVEKVLQLAKIERENFKLNKEKIDLHELLDNILNSVKLQVEKAGGQLGTDLGATNPTVYADKLHLTNILHNLLDNAMKYCKEVPNITVKTCNTPGGKVKLSIQDRGLGIAKENLSKIFDKFYRVPTGDVHNVKGFGLGLFYTKNICDAHGWKISIESEPDTGTSVTILLG